MSCKPAFAELAEPLSALAKMPVREITVFKDGHALVLHEGTMQTDGEGNVVMDYLPTPVLGTFWPFSTDKNARLTSVVASRHKVLVPRTTLTLSTMLEGNPGAQVQVTALSGSGTNTTTVTYDATIIGVPTRTSQELEETNPPNSGEKLPEKSGLVMLKTAEGVMVLPLERIQNLAFKQSYNKKLSDEELRNVLTMKLDWQHNKPASTADVGMMYVQSGMRWIPNYKVSIDDSGKASVKLQATLVNDLTDLNDVTANLVIGVPSIAMKNETDPMALQQVVAGVLAGMDRSRSVNAFSNAIASQVLAGAGGYRDENSQVQQAAHPEVSGGEKNEDLYVFMVKHISLKKGQRMVVPVAECILPFKDVYTLDVPFSPPPELRPLSNRSSEVASLIQAPSVEHKIRLKNSSPYPLTTAPALILHKNRILAQGLMTYAAPGSSEDLAITTAVDIKVKKTDRETARIPRAFSWQGYDYARIELAGTLSLTNFTHKPVELEIKRRVLGKVMKAEHNGIPEMINVFEDPHLAEYPRWWGWFSWPDWWHHVNGIGSIDWKLTLAPSESVNLGYTWQYYWR
ncbi:MAG: hypothetical protein HY711_09220 [Candidatus Melainabacteria bacterium]|nr:hypothetical protein [Candidatus Melainabacteria bacterium]